MEKLFYPALFHKTESGGFWVSFPDLPECLTEGENMANAYEMSVDALGICLSYMEDNKEPIPVASDPTTIHVEEGAVVVIIEFDMLAYRKKNNSKAVKKTLSIPEWLNEEATAIGVNFSQVLQEALMQKLGRN